MEAGDPVGLIERGMAVSAVSGDDSVTVQTFKMKFSDVKSDDLNTVNEIKSLTEKTPVINEITELQVQPYKDYPKSSAKNAFEIDEDLKETSLLTKVYEIIITSSDTESGDVITTYSTENTGRMAVVPMAVRIKIPSTDAKLKNIWEELEAAEDNEALFRIFRQYYSVWVRSSATGEYDSDLFNALDYTQAGNGANYNAEDCVSAFVDDDYLYLDFMVFAADAVSTNKTQKTAFIKIFEDDGEPYVIIGDGDVDARINLAFYVDTPGETPAETASGTTTASGAGGGSCNINPFGAVLLISMLALKLRMKR